MTRTFYTFCLILISFFSFSQSATIRGIVYNKDNGEPVAFSNVYLKGTTIGASTDLNGFFSINKVSPGAFTLLVTNLEFDTISEYITIKAGEIITKKFYCSKGGVMLNAVDVTAEQLEKIETPNVGVQKIDPVAINKLPSVGEPDLAQYLQVLPGVVFTGDQGGQLYIRGGLPIQNKVLLDGMVIYNPFHSIGLFSVFDNDIMRSADVFSAGFGAEYGGRTSSIMDITTRDGNKKHLSGKVSGSTFGAKLTLEGPLKKLKEDGKGSSSFLLSGKTSYLPQTSKTLYPYANRNNDDGLPFYYTDLYGKVSFNGGNGSKVNLFGYNFTDKVVYKDLAKFNWTSFGGGSNFILIPQNSTLLIEGNFAYSQYKINYEGSTETDKKSSSVGGFNGGFNFLKYFGRNELKYGFELVGTNTNYEIQTPTLSKIGYAKNSLELGAHMKFRWLDKKKWIVLEPSFRLQYYASFNDLSPEPRLQGKINFTRKIRFKFAGGLYSQSLMSASSDRDVVNLFYGFINGPENLPAEYKNQKNETVATKGVIQKANHIVGGFEIDVFKNLEIQIEGYQKYFTQMASVNRDKLFDDIPENADKLDANKKDFIMEQGRAQGLDFTAKYEKKRFYFWAVYSLTFNKRYTGNTASGDVFEYAPVFDRRHNVNLVGTYTFGKKRNLDLSIRWNYGSGFPFTPTQGYYPQIDFGNNFNYNYTTSNANLGYVPGDYNSRRLPDYHRMDISLKWLYNISEKTKLEVNVGATNLYNRENIFYYDRVRNKRVNQLPILPNVNISFKF
ncbi:MAG: TonB-dependent receptor [Bacteroidia bacterium]|nr:TonB-dependent receptor [Bacteroidia bacterium]